MREYLPVPQVYRSFVFRRSRDLLLKFQFVKYTGIEQLFRSPTVPQLLIVVVQTLPVFSELLEAVLIDVVKHTSSTPRNLPPLFHTLHLPLPVRLRLALHVVIIVGTAPRSNEE